MIETIVTVGQLLNADPKGLTPVQLKLLNGSEAMTAVRTALAAVPSIKLDDLTTALGEAIQPVLNMGVGEVLAGGWNTARKLWPYRKQAPGKTESVELTKHTIEARLTPRIGVAVGGVDIPKAQLTLTLTLSIVVHAVELQIRDSRIIGAKVARCTGSGKLSLPGATLLERPLFEFAVPAISFGEGIAIA